MNVGSVAPLVSSAAPRLHKQDIPFEVFRVALIHNSKHQSELTPREVAFYLSMILCAFATRVFSTPQQPNRWRQIASLSRGTCPQKVGCSTPRENRLVRVPREYIRRGRFFVYHH